MCHPMLVLPCLQDFDVANAEVGAERNPLKTEVIYNVNDLDAAPAEWRIGDVWSLAKTSAIAYGSCWVLAVIRGPATEQGRCHPRNARGCSTLPGSAARVLPPPRESEGQRIHGHTVLQEQSAAAVYDENGQRSLSSPVSRRTARRKQPLVRTNQESGSRERETSQPQLIWEPSSKPSR